MNEQVVQVDASTAVDVPEFLKRKLDEQHSDGVTIVQDDSDEVEVPEGQVND